MKKQELFDYLMEELEIESVKKIDENTILKDLEEWDSLASLVLITFADEHFGIKLSNDDIKQITDVKSFIKKLGINQFED
jgi:acyl carrier protein